MSRALAIVLCLAALAAAVWLVRRSPESGDPTALAPAARPRDAGSPREGAPARDRMPGVPSLPGAQGGLADAPPRAIAPAPVAPGGAAAGDDDGDTEKLIAMALGDRDPTNRAAAIGDLSLAKDPQPFLPVFEKAADDQDPEVRLAVVGALAQLGENAPVALLDRFVDDADPEVRLEILDVLADLAEEDALPARARPLLEKASRDRDEDVRARAGEILEYLDQLSGASEGDGE